MPRKFRIVTNPKQYPDMFDTFEEFYALWAADLVKIAYSDAWKFRATDSDGMGECMAELHSSFWQAYMHWRPAMGQFGKFFWSIWLNRLSSINRHNSAEKRRGQVVELTESTEDDFSGWHPSLGQEEWQIIHLPLFKCHPMEQPVITMLAQGFRPTDVEALVGRSMYRQVTRRWKAAYLQWIEKDL